jgi:hypothetical protein
LTERDILIEIEKRIDINKEEDFIEGFIKEKQKQPSNGEIFSIYKLKSKVMNEKIEKIKKQFEDQSATVDSIKRLLDDNLSIIKANVDELREVGSIDNPSLANHHPNIELPKSTSDDQTIAVIESLKQKQSVIE